MTLNNFSYKWNDTHQLGWASWSCYTASPCTSWSWLAHTWGRTHPGAGEPLRPSWSPDRGSELPAWRRSLGAGVPLVSLSLFSTCPVCLAGVWWRCPSYGPSSSSKEEFRCQNCADLEIRFKSLGVQQQNDGRSSQQDGSGRRRVKSLVDRLRSSSLW